MPFFLFIFISCFLIFSRQYFKHCLAMHGEENHWHVNCPAEKCDFMSSLQNVMHHHTRAHLDINTYHRQVKHPADGFLKCPHCDLTGMSTIQELWKHLKQHKDAVIICIIKKCEYHEESWTTRNKLLGHLSDVHGYDDTNIFELNSSKIRYAYVCIIIYCLIFFRAIYITFSHPPWGGNDKNCIEKPKKMRIWIWESQKLWIRILIPHKFCRLLW